MFWLFVVLAVVAVVLIALVAVGREALGGALRARPAVFEVEEAVRFISDGLPVDVASRLTPDDVRWILQTDADSLEEATSDPERLDLGSEVLDEDVAVALVLQRADAAGRELVDADVAAVLDGRTRYLRAIGAFGPEAAPDEATGGAGAPGDPH